MTTTDDSPFWITEMIQKWKEDVGKRAFRLQDFLRWVLDILLILWVIPILPVFLLYEYSHRERIRSTILENRARLREKR